MTFTFRELCLPDDAEMLRELLVLGFPELEGTTGGTVDHLHWKFSRSLPYALCVVGFEAGRAVSFYGVVPRDYLVDGERRRIGLVVDVMSHPEVRRRGLFEQTGRFALAGLQHSPVEAVVGFPVRDDVMPGHLKVGWEVGFKLPVYLLPTGGGFRESSGEASWLTAFRLAGGAYRRLTAALRKRPKATTQQLTVTEFVENPIAQRLCGSDGVNSRIERSLEFLCWRLGRPGATYVCLVSTHGERAAYAIARSTVLRGVRCLAVLDLAVDGKGAQRLVVGALVDFARREHLAAIVMWLPIGSHAKAIGLSSVGFLRTPMKFTLIHRSTSQLETRQLFADESRWRMSWLDSDTI